MKDLDLLLHKEKGIWFKTAPVSGHNFHGAVERKIRSVQECLEKSEIDKQRVHATGLQTIAKLIEKNPAKEENYLSLWNNCNQVVDYLNRFQ